MWAWGCLMIRFAVCLILVAACAVPCAGAATVVIRNNYDFAYAGPVSFRANLPDGNYAGKDASGSVRSGVARVVAKLAARSSVRLNRVQSKPASAGALTLAPARGGAALCRQRKTVGELHLGLVVVPGRSGGTDDAVSSFEPLDVRLTPTFDGALWGKTRSGDYDVSITVRPYAGGWLDIDAEIVNTSADRGSAYIALVRRITTSGVADCRMRWNGRLVDGSDEPSKYEGSYGYTHCVDWFSWRSAGFSYLMVNGFTPGLTTEQSPGRWNNANHSYVWEHARKQGDALYFISEIAGPDPSQKPGYKGIKAYMTPLAGEPVKLHYRLALANSPEPTWQESQFAVTAGYRGISTEGGAVTVDLGVRFVEFGTSYFPYSTFCENFDYYRTPSLDREGWWPFAPKMWENWRAFAPQMRTDLRIIRAMGFEWVRMHHLELVAGMDRANAMSFIDFYMSECRKLGLKVMVDTSGTPQWFGMLAGRYKDVVKRIEIENEVLIPGIKPGDAERWTACYKAAKQAAPDTDVFLTGNCNVGMFDRLARLGVPFDRLGYHTYKHGPGGEETLSSLAVAVAGVAADRGKTPILSEFNWKMLTRLSPEARAKEFALIYSKILEPRAVPELLQFHWQETMSVNPRLTRQGIRHYETIYLDRRPKPEAIELMKLIRKYCRADAPVRELPVRVSETVFHKGKARAQFTVTNATSKPLTVKLSAECFGDAQGRIASTRSISLKPGKSATGAVEIALKPGVEPGVYHFFVRADYSGKASYGWGYASNLGVTAFNAEPILPDLVDYPTGTHVLDRIDWKRPVCVAFGSEASVVELEMAYMVFNTLQSATGRVLRLCSVEDMPADMAANGNLILVGTPQSSKLLGLESPRLSAGKGSVQLVVHPAQDGGKVTWVLLTGESSQAVEAAAIDFVLRYWKNAKDSAIRATGLEKGAALGSPAAKGQVNPP